MKVSSPASRASRDHAARAAGDDTDSATGSGAAGNQSRYRRAGAQRPIELGRERLAGGESRRRLPPDPDRAPR